MVGCDDSPKGFERRVVPATLTPEELLKSSVWRRKAIMGSQKVLDDKDINSMIETSNDEVARGFLEGPFSEQKAALCGLPFCMFFFSLDFLLFLRKFIYFFLEI